MKEFWKKIKEWTIQKADTFYARLWLVGLSFTESSVFFIPPDPLLVAMVLVRRDRWLKYTIIVSSASIMGAIFGYIIGALLFNTIGLQLITLYSLQSQMAYAIQLVQKGVFFFTLIMAFTPIPFKVAVLAAGFTKANFLAFIVAVIGGRFARYALLAYVVKVFGDNAGTILKRFWWYATALGVLLLIGYIIFLFFFR